MAAGGDDVSLVDFEIHVEVAQHMVSDVARLIAQRVELGQAISGGGAAGDEVLAHVAERLLQLRVGKRLVRILLEGG